MSGTEVPYWMQEPMQPSETAYILPGQIPQETSYQQNDFPVTYNNDLYQPEEIFQLDQPLRSDFNINNNDVTRSPPSLLDLGSGTIKYEMSEMHEQTYWTQLLSEDSSSSHISVQQGHEPDKVTQCQTYNTYQTQTNWGQENRLDYPVCSGFEMQKDMKTSQIISSHSPISQVPVTTNYSNFENYQPMESSQRILDDRLSYDNQNQCRQIYSGHHNNQLTNQPVNVIQDNNYFYSNGTDDRCNYNCDVLDTRLTNLQTNNSDS